jgi:hypothetical protein
MVTHLFCEAWGIDDPEPHWFDEPGIGRLTVTSPHEERAFHAYNRRRRYRDRVRPWNFLMMAHLPRHARLTTGQRQSLVAPFEKNPRKRRRARWVDRGNPDAPSAPIRTGVGPYVVKAATLVQSYRNVYEDYRTHPEVKAGRPDGAPCKEWTMGLLQPLEVIVGEVRLIGKESNRLSEDDTVDGPQDRAIEYPERTCRGCGTALQGRQRDWCSEACRKRSARSRAVQSAQ